MRHRDQRRHRRWSRGGFCDGAASTRETITRSEGRRRWCRVVGGAIAGDRPQCELTPHSHRTQTGSSIGCESVTQQRIVQRIGSDAVEDRDEGRRGDRDWRCDRKQQWWRRWLVHRPPSLGQRCAHHSALRGLPSLHSIATRPTVARRGTMYVCVHRVALSAAPPPAYFVTAHGSFVTFSFSSVTSLMFKPVKMIAIDGISCATSNVV